MHPLAIIPAILAALFFLSTAVWAQPASPSAPAASAAQPGPGPGRGMGPRFGRDYTPGWSMMSRAEREEHRRQMLEAKTPEECQKIRDEHRKLMAERAKERGVTMRGPRRDPCAYYRK